MSKFHWLDKKQIAEAEEDQTHNSRILAADLERKRMIRFAKDLIQYLIKPPSKFNIKFKICNCIHLQKCWYRQYWKYWKKTTSRCSIWKWTYQLYYFLVYYHELQNSLNGSWKVYQRREHIGNLPPVELVRSYDRQNIGIQQLLSSHSEASRAGLRKEILKTKLIEPI